MTRPGAEQFAKIPLRAARSRDLAGRDFRVLIAIAAHADAGGRAYPSLARIASLAAADRTKVPGSIRKLVAAGLLRAQRRMDAHGDSTSTLYRIVFDEDGVLPNPATPVAASGNTVLPRVGTPGVPEDGTLTDHYLTDQRTPSAPRASRERVDNRDGASQFEAFWQVYPSRHPHPHPKEPARKKFEALVKAGIDPGVISRGAANYAAYVGQHLIDSRYFKQPATWLNQRGWEQYQQAPEPPRLRVGFN